MKKLVVCAVMMGLMITGLATGVLAGGDVTIDMYSAYVWRGQVLTTGGVLQPAFSMETPIGLNLGAWGNMDLTDKNQEQWEFNEVDLMASYALPLEGPV